MAAHPRDHMAVAPPAREILVPLLTFLVAAQGIEARISRMNDLHSKHEHESREYRHRQNAISHQILRVREPSRSARGPAR